MDDYLLVLCKVNDFFRDMQKFAHSDKFPPLKTAIATNPAATPPLFSTRSQTGCHPYEDRRIRTPTSGPTIPMAIACHPVGDDASFAEGFDRG